MGFSKAAAIHRLYGHAVYLHELRRTGKKITKIWATMVCRHCGCNVKI